MKLIDEQGNEIADATVLNLQAGDICVLQVPQRLTRETRREIKEQWDRYFPKRKMILLDDGVTLAVMRPAEAVA